MELKIPAIGSTDISAIAGTNSFSGPWEVYNRLTKELPDKDAPHLRLGRDIEWFIITDAFKRLDKRWLIELGLPESYVRTATLKKEKPRYFDATFVRKKPTRPNFTTQQAPASVAIFRSTPDGRLVANARAQRPIFTIEAKTAFYADRELWANPLGDYEDRDDGPLVESSVPAAYYDQAQWHMATTGTEVCLLPVIFDFTSYSQVYFVRRNRFRIATLLELGEQFWADYIVGDDTPSPDASEGMKLHLALQEVRSEDFLPANDGDYDAMRRLLVAREAKKTATSIEAECQNRLKLRVVESGMSGIIFDGEFKGRFNFKMNKAGKRTVSMKGIKAA